MLVEGVEQDVREIIDAEGFASAGRAALSMRGTVHRNTNDLDLLIGHDDIE